MINSKVFFATEGSCLSSTSANHIANLAKELVKGHQRDIEGMSFTNKLVYALGQSEKTVLQKGASESELEDVKRKLTEIGEANSLIAWLREGIKAKNALIAQIENATFEDYCEWEHIEPTTYPSLEEYMKEHGVEGMPKLPEEEPLLSELDILDRWDENEHLNYLTLQSEYESLDSSIEDFGLSLKELVDAKNGAYTTPDSQSTEVHHLSPTISRSSVEATLKALSDRRDEVEKKLRSYRKRIEKQLADDAKVKNAEYLSRKAEYDRAYAEYQALREDYMHRTQEIRGAIMENLEADFEAYKVRKAKEVGDLKIVIPASLTGIFAKVSNLGKK